jgi:hypothetical protein
VKYLIAAFFAAALAVHPAEAKSRKAAGDSAHIVKNRAATSQLISESECRRIHGGLVLSSACHSGGACRTTSVNGDGQLVTHDECLSAR